MAKYNYKFDVQKFNKQFLDSKGSLIHRISDSCIQIFPFQANAKRIEINHEVFREIVGRYFLKSEKLRNDKPIIEDELISEMLNSDFLEIDVDDKDNFKSILEDRFFSVQGNLKPESLLAFELGKSDTDDTSSEMRKAITRNAEYLSNVLGTNSVVENLVKKAKYEEDEEFDALQKFFFSFFDNWSNNENNSELSKYFKVFDAFDEVYNSDLEYLLSRKQRFDSRELINLLRLYYFSYTSQTIETLNQFLNGSRTKITPFYFILDWEKISRSRLAVTDGWELLKSRLYSLMAQQVTLIILNMIKDIDISENKPVVFDYIKLKQFIDYGYLTELEVAEQIKQMADYYRQHIIDSPKMNQIERESDEVGTVKQEIDYLFNSIKIQFQSTRRSRISDNYPSEFEKICDKFLKSKGRLGKVLAVNQESLLFLTQIAIKDQDKIRLNDLFDEFERRGIYLDNISKKKAADYFEELNLIEKKSDSGDAKYVRNIH